MASIHSLLRHPSSSSRRRWLVSIGQDDFALFQLPQLQLDGEVLRDAEMHGAGAGGVGDLNGASNQAYVDRVKGSRLWIIEGLTEIEVPFLNLVMFGCFAARK